MTFCLNAHSERGTEVVRLGHDDPPWKKAHPAPCQTKAVARPLSLGGKMGPRVLLVLDCQRHWQ